MIKNIYTDLQSGDYMIKKDGSDGITPIVNEERNLPAFKDEEESYSNQVDKLSFAYEAVRGDVDTQATLGQTQMAVSQGTSVYAFKKENFGLFLQGFFNELVLPQLMNDLTPEHIMRFTGTVEELNRLDEAAADVYANDFLKKQILSGRMVTQEDQQALIQKAKDTYQKLGEARYLKIKENFYQDAEFEFDFIITNEQADPGRLAQNIQALIAEYDPMKMQDPVYALLIGKQADAVGISSSEFELASQKQGKQQQDMQAQQAQMTQMNTKPTPNAPQMTPSQPMQWPYHKH